MSANPSRDGPNGEFHCTVEPEGDSVRVVPFGELDLETAGEVEAQLRSLWRARFPEVVLELRNLTFMDSTALHLILRTDEQARHDGTAFVLVPGSPVVQRLFDLTGVRDRLTFREYSRGRQAWSRLSPAPGRSLRGGGGRAYVKRPGPARTVSYPGKETAVGVDPPRRAPSALAER